MTAGELGARRTPAADGQQRLEWSAIVLPAAAILVLLLVWELAPRAGLVRPTSIPPVSRVAQEVGVVLQGADGFWGEVAASSRRWLIGFVLAIALGVPLGVLMGRSRLVFSAIDPILTVTYPVPKAALILILVLFFGAGDVSRITIIILGCFIPIVTSSYHGAHGVEPRLEWGARSLGAGRARSLFTVTLPAALPQILSGIRLGVAISLFALLASELLIRQSGIGSYLFRYYDLGATLRVWAVATVIAFFGFLVDFVYVRVVRRAMPWLEGEI